jgi:UDP-glucose 4-epimerase
MANILVTGGAGYVGSVCCAELLRLGHSVTIVDDLSTGFRDNVVQGAEFQQADFADPNIMPGLLARSRFDAVFHFAAKALVAESCATPAPYFHSNVVGGHNFLEMLLNAGVKRFVFSSSAATYGVPQRVPLEEDDPKSPINAYGETKLIFEQILKWYALAYGFSAIAFRYFNAAGGTREHGERHDPETHAIPLLLAAAAGEREFTVCGGDYPTPDGTCVRDYVHVLDIARAHIAALDHMQQPGMRAYNIGTGRGTSMRELHKAVERAVGHAVPVKTGPRRAGDPPVLCASPARLQKEFGWKAQCSSLDQIIRSAWEFRQSQRH